MAFGDKQVWAFFLSWQHIIHVLDAVEMAGIAVRLGNLFPFFFIGKHEQKHEGQGSSSPLLSVVSPILQAV